MIRGPTTLKEFITIYKFCKRDNENEGAYDVVAVSGLELFPSYPHCDLSCLIVYVDPIKKNVLVLKNSFKPFW